VWHEICARSYPVFPIDEVGCLGQTRIGTGKQRENGIREREDMPDDDDENEIMFIVLLIVTSRKTVLPLDRYRVF